MPSLFDRNHNIVLAAESGMTRPVVLNVVKILCWSMTDNVTIFRVHFTFPKELFKQGLVDHVHLRYIPLPTRPFGQDNEDPHALQ